MKITYPLSKEEFIDANIQLTHFLGNTQKILRQRFLTVLILLVLLSIVLQSALVMIGILKSFNIVFLVVLYVVLAILAYINSKLRKDSIIKSEMIRLVGQQFPEEGYDKQVIHLTEKSFVYPFGETILTVPWDQIIDLKETDQFLFPRNESNEWYIIPKKHIHQIDQVKQYILKKIDENINEEHHATF